MPIEETLCPECGARMISRKGPYGMFWGCSTYPKCNGNRDVNGRSKADRDKWREEQEEKENE